MKSSRKKRPSLKKSEPPSAWLDSPSKADLFNSMVVFLNGAFKADPDAMHALICNRVPCNMALADHPTVQVQVVPRPTGHAFAVGMGGVLAGLSETLTGRRIATMFSEPDPKTGVSMVMGFCEFKPTKTKSK